MVLAASTSRNDFQVSAMVQLLSVWQQKTGEGLSSKVFFFSAYTSDAAGYRSRHSKRVSTDVRDTWPYCISTLQESIAFIVACTK